MLHLKDVSRREAGRTLLSDISLDVDQGELVSVLGPTGSGKTSLLRLILGLDLPSSGEIWLGDALVASAQGNLIAPELRGISMVFEHSVLLPFMDASANVTLGAATLDADARRRRDELLTLLELGALAARAPAHLSGGEQQRVALARALFVRPRLLLLDEPFRNIDRPWRDRFLPAFKRHLEQQGTTAIMVTHDRDEAFGFSQRIFLLRDGRLLRGDTPQQLYQRPDSVWAARLLGECNQLPVSVARSVLGIEPSDALVTSVLVRPEHIEVASDPPHNATLRQLQYYGFYRALEFATQDEVQVQVKVLDGRDYQPGQSYRLRLRHAELAQELRSGTLEREQAAS